jgi:hypothetical protein
MASVAPVAAKAASVSPGGMEEARPGVRVRITDWATPGSVSSAPSAAAAAAKEGTPGVTVHGMPMASSLRVCSPMADQTERSPEWRRATSCPAAWAAAISAMMASRSRGAVFTIRAPGGQWARIASGTSEPA